MLDTGTIRPDFPILERQIHGHPLIYLDNAATSHKPHQVLEAMTDYYMNHNANIHRGVHTLSDESTRMYEQARQTVANLIHAQSANEIMFTRNTTAGINLISMSWGSNHIQADDEVIVTELEHHSNFLPWQRMCRLKHAKLIIVPVDGNGDLALSEVISLVNDRTKLVCITHVSNVLGTRVDIQHVAKAIHQANPATAVLVDGAQSVPHQPVDVQALNCDFLVFSAHKMLGPQGIGALYVNHAILDELEPFIIGGGMISEVFADYATWADLPERFDAGTPDVAGAVGFAAACDYLDHVGMTAVADHEQALLAYGLEKLSVLESQGLISLYGPRTVKERAAILTFNVTGVHAHDAAQILDRESGIAVRSGHHCNQLLTRKLGVPATVRASFYLYNTLEEIDRLAEGITRVKEIIK